MPFGRLFGAQHRDGVLHGDFILRSKAATVGIARAGLWCHVLGFSGEAQGNRSAAHPDTGPATASSALAFRPARLEPSFAVKLATAGGADGSAARFESRD